MNKILISIICMMTGCLCSCGQKKYADAGTNEFQTIISNDSVQTVDVRHADEFASGYIPSKATINIDVLQSNFKELAEKELDKNRPVAVYCRSGRRSATAARILANDGYVVTNLEGGITAWKTTAKPVQMPGDLFNTASGKTIGIELYHHASLGITYNGYRMEIDPVGKQGAISYKGMKADAVIITHEHFDHYSKDDVDELMKSAKTLVVNKRVADIYEMGTVLNYGDSIQLTEGVSIKAVPAYNTSAESSKFHPKGRDNGYIITIENVRIYIAGDTQPIPDMLHLGPIDVAFLPCNLPYTMTPDELIEAARMINPKVLYPYHFKDIHADYVISKLKNTGIDIRIRNME